MISTSPAGDRMDMNNMPDELVHHYCTCTPGKGLCGTELEDGDPLDPDTFPLSCVVCAELEGGLCPYCWNYPDG